MIIFAKKNLKIYEFCNYIFPKAKEKLLGKEGEPKSIHAHSWYLTS